MNENSSIDSVSLLTPVVVIERNNFGALATAGSGRGTSELRCVTPGGGPAGLRAAAAVAAAELVYAACKHAFMHACKGTDCFCLQMQSRSFVLQATFDRGRTGAGGRGEAWRGGSGLESGLGLTGLAPRRGRRSRRRRRTR